MSENGVSHSLETVQTNTTTRHPMELVTSKTALFRGICCQQWPDCLPKTHNYLNWPTLYSQNCSLIVKHIKMNIYAK